MDLPLNRSKVRQSYVDGLGTVCIPHMGMGCSMGASYSHPARLQARRTDILSAVCDLKGDSFQLGKLLIL